MRPEWFAPKRYGYGAGLPIAWQGWAILAAFLLLIAFAQLLPIYLRLAATVLLVTGVVLVAAYTTKGGWRWRG